MANFVGDSAYAGQYDSLSGTSLDDEMWGLDGNDVLRGNNGQDKIAGGNGNDEMDGGNGDDTLWGEAGRDNLDGGFGDDTLIGGSGNDELNGDDGADSQHGGSGNDTIFYDVEDIVMDGGSGEDILKTQAGHIELGLGNVLNMEVIDLTDGFGNEVQGSGAYSKIDPVAGTITHLSNLLTINDVADATDGSNSLLVKGDLGDKVLLDTDWTSAGTDLHGNSVFSGLDSAGNTVTLTVEFEVEAAMI